MAKKNVKSLKIKTHYVYTKKGAEKKENKTEIQAALEKILKTVRSQDQDEGVYTTAKFFRSLFSKNVSEVTGDKRLVKITSLKTKKSVYRIWHGITTDNLGFGIETKDIVYLDSEAKWLLTGSSADDSENDEPVELAFKQVGVFEYYLHCKNRFNKSSYTISLISGFLGFVSLIVSIIGFFK